MGCRCAMRTAILFAAHSAAAAPSSSSPLSVTAGDGVERGCRSFEQSLSGRCFRNLSVIAEAGDGVTNFAPAARKPIWLVDQTMGNRELFRREPSAQEERAVTYLALIHGASGTLMTHPSSGPFPRQLDGLPAFFGKR